MSSNKDDVVVCRACIKQTTQYKDIHRHLLIRDELTTLASILSDCTNLDFLENEDFLPSNLCYECIQNVVKLYVFKRSVIKSDEELRHQHSQLIVDNQLMENWQELVANVVATRRKQEKERSYVKLSFVDEIKHDDDVQDEDQVEDNPVDKSEIFEEEELLTTETNRTESLSEIDYREPECVKNDLSDSIDSVDLKCNICGNVLGNVKSYRYHMRKHNMTPTNICELCGRSFRALSLYRVHMLSHTGEKPFKCEICGKGLSQKSGYKKHMLTHTGEKPFTCDTCGQDFRFSSNLNKHKLIHTGVKRFECNVCEKRFISKEKLKKHSLVHTGEKPFNCVICNKNFQQHSYLAIHRMKMHKGISIEEALSNRMANDKAEA